MKKLTSILYFLLILFSLDAQENDLKIDDSIPVYNINEVIITANRFENQMMNSASSVSLITTRQLASYPVQRFSNLLSLIPGLTVVNSDGIGRSPIVGIRGFYGGGEAEYIKVLIDGVPINDLENGIANWNVIPVKDIRKIELIKGGGSAAYGDAAMGGVLNVITNPVDKTEVSGEFGIGNFKSYNIGANIKSKIGSNPFRIYASHDLSEGFRDHSNWASTNFGGSLYIPLSKRSGLSLSTYNQLVKTKEPGPIVDEILDNDRKSSLDYFRADGKDESRYSAHLIYKSQFAHHSELQANFNFQHKSINNISTLIQPVFIVDTMFQPKRVFDTTFYGDTKRRKLNTSTMKYGVNYIKNLKLPQEHELRIIVGWDGSAGFYQSQWVDVFKGFEIDYSNSYNPTDIINSDGKGTRIENGLFFNGEMSFFRRYKLIAGFRYDNIRDNYEGKTPDTSFSPVNSSFSPKIGLTADIASNNQYKGSIYLNYNESFKAPAIDQLTDFKSGNFAVFLEPFPQYYVFIPYLASPFSNSALKPQKSKSWEIGTYQYVKVSEQISLTAQLSVYTTRVRDEIDFDLSTLSYQNISETSHQGIEASLNLDFLEQWRASLNYSLSEVKFLKGENDGKRLKGIPKHNFQTYVGYYSDQGLFGAVMFNYLADNFLDDDNAQKLNDFGFVNLKLGYRINQISLNLGIDNLFNDHYSSNGYNLYGTNFYFPSAGRIIKANIEFNF